MNRRQIHRVSGWLLVAAVLSPLSLIAVGILRRLWVEVHPLVAVGVVVVFVALAVHIASDNPDSLSL